MAKEKDSREFDVQETQDIDPSRASTAAESQRIVPVAGPLNKAYLNELAFMEEELVVMVHESADPNSENPVTVGCNGVFRQFFRGVPMKAKRKFVECLIVKQGRVTTPEYVNAGGERARAIRQTSAHKYPFSVVEDRNPKGAEWLKRRLAEAY